MKFFIFKINRQSLIKRSENYYTKFIHGGGGDALINKGLCCNTPSIPLISPRHVRLTSQFKLQKTRFNKLDFSRSSGLLNPLINNFFILKTITRMLIIR